MNVRCHVGTTASSRLHEAAQATFVACQPQITDGAEIAEFEDFSGDPAHGIEVVDGVIRIPDAPGFGIEVDTARLELTGRSEQDEGAAR